MARGGAARLPGRSSTASAGGACSGCFDAGDFSGKRDETALVYPPGPAARILLVGMGKAEEVSRGAIRRAASIAAQADARTSA